MDMPEFARPDFNATVWEIARQIPAGRVANYGFIAAMIPPPPGVSPDDYALYRARWVGSAMSLSPAGVPWQRVINAQGKISLAKGGFAEKQRRLLEAEGVEFDARVRVNMARFGWDGPPEDWLRERGLIPPPVAPRQDSLFS